jgi:hypothetical protein
MGCGLTKAQASSGTNAASSRSNISDRAISGGERRALKQIRRLGSSPPDEVTATLFGVAPQPDPVRGSALFPVAARTGSPTDPDAVRPFHTPPVVPASDDTHVVDMELLSFGARRYPRDASAASHHSDPTAVLRESGLYSSIEGSETDPLDRGALPRRQVRRSVSRESQLSSVSSRTSTANSTSQVVAAAASATAPTRTKLIPPPGLRDALHRHETLKGLQLLREAIKGIALDKEGNFSGKYLLDGREYDGGNFLRAELGILKNFLDEFTIKKATDNRAKLSELIADEKKSRTICYLI